MGVSVHRYPNTADVSYVDRFHPVLVFTADNYFTKKIDGISYVQPEPYLHLVHRLLRSFVNGALAHMISSGWAKRCNLREVISMDVGFNNVCGQAWIQSDGRSLPGILKHKVDLDHRIRKLLGRLSVASSGVLEETLRSKQPDLPNIWRGGRTDQYGKLTTELHGWFLLDSAERPLNRIASATVVAQSTMRLCEHCPGRTDSKANKGRSFCAKNGCCGPDGDLIALLNSDCFAHVAPSEAVSALRQQHNTGVVVPIQWADQKGNSSTKELSCHRDKSNGKAVDDAYLSALHGVIEFDSLDLTTKVFLVFHGHYGHFVHVSFLAYGREFLTNRAEAIEKKILVGPAKYIHDRLTSKALEMDQSTSNDYDYTEFIMSTERLQSYAKKHLVNGENGYGTREDYNGPYFLRRACE